MARKQDAAAAKRRQQKMILIVGAVLLAGLLAFQLPKMMKHGKSASSAAASSESSAISATSDSSSSTSTSGTTATPTTSPVAAVTTLHPTGPAAKLAGIVVQSAGAPKARAGQLWTLTRFNAKDPFVQQVKPAMPGAPVPSSGSGSATGGKTGASGGTDAGAGGGITGGTVVPTPPAATAFGYATLMVNGKAQQLQLKSVFPKGDPTFVLREVGKGFIKVGVAGGKFTDGTAVKLEQGKRVVLMNTATGQRFVMKLVYTGAQPELIANFKSAAGNAAAPAAKSTTP